MKGLHQLRKIPLIKIPENVQARILQYRRDYETENIEVRWHFLSQRLEFNIRFEDEDEDGDIVWEWTGFSSTSPMPEYYMGMYDLSEFNWSMIDELTAT
jgi:hypothetical protein